MHKVLVLGAGLVSRPIVRYFLDNEGFDLTVGRIPRNDIDPPFRESPVRQPEIEFSWGARKSDSVVRLETTEAVCSFDELVTRTETPFGNMRDRL